MGVFSFNKYIINTSNLVKNIEYIKSKLNPGVKVCAVVKADAYGVGIKNIIEILNKEVDAFAVANLEEGIELRTLTKINKIIVLGALNLHEIKQYEKYFLSPTVSSAFEMNKLSSDTKNPLSVEFGLNTGMNRIGFSEKSEIFEAISLLNKNKNLSISGVYSHLATKQNDVDFMMYQKLKFDHLLEPFKNKKITRHLSNSSATLNNKDFNYDMVRVGFSMYGMGDESEGLARVIEIKSQVVKINKVGVGDSVGYDRTFMANRDSLIAVIPIGYYDGVARGLSNKGRVLIDGKFAPIVGRVCMDMLMVDVTDILGVHIGDEVVVIGRSGVNEITIKEHAEIVGTSEYEILSRFNNSRMNIVLND